jgi:predicted TIM-barrel fold metal-dependent hydrolase
VIIDAHAHVSGPPELYEHFRDLAGRAPGIHPQPIEISDELIRDSLTDHLESVASVGTEMQFVVGRPWAIPTALRQEALVMYITQQVNNLFERCVRLYPDRFVAMATLPQVAGIGTRGCAEELERCVKDLGFIGVKINCDPGEGGISTPHLGDEYWYPLYEKMVELDVPGLLHGGHYNYSREPELGYYPAEVTTGAWALLRTPQVFKDFPNLKIIVGHGGGYLPYQLGRARAFRLHEMTANPSLESFDESLKRLYFDTVLYNPESVELLLKLAGVDHCLFGTDRPASGDVVDPETGRPMNDIKSYIDEISWLTEENRQAIYEGNARRLFTRLRIPVNQ